MGRSVSVRGAFIHREVDPFRTARDGGWVEGGLRKGGSRLRYIVCLYTTLGFVHSRYICQKVYSRSI